MSSIVKMSIDYFANPDKGRPIAFGNIYVGTIDLDPEIPANQKQISIIQESGATVEVSQPLKTSAGGVPVYDGSPVTIVVDGDYSLKVTDKNDDQVYYIPMSSALAGQYVVSTIDTIQELRDSSLHLTAKAVDVLGYYLKGDKGGGTTRYLSDIESIGTFVDNGGKIIVPTGGDGSIAWLTNGSLNALEWGCVGDGITGDSARLQVAIDYVSDNIGSEIIIPETSATYLIDSKINLKKNVVLTGENVNSTLEVGTNDDIIVATGSINGSQGNFLSSDAARGAITITLTSGKGSNFSEDDWALIVSEALIENGAGTDHKGEFIRIKSIAGDVLTLEGPILDSYLTSFISQVQKITMVENTGLKNLTIVNNDVVNYKGNSAQFQFCYMALVENVIIKKGKTVGLFFQGCVGGKVLNCSAYDMESGGGTGFGYMVAEGAANQGFIMDSCYSERVRHTYTTVEGKDVSGFTLGYGVPSSSIISDTNAFNPRAAGFDTHAQGRDIKFIGCSVRGGSREGIQTRAVDVTLDTCTVYACMAGGFTFPESIRTIANNCVASSSNLGVDPETSVDWTLRGAFYINGESVSLKNCSVRRSGGHGYHVTDALIVKDVSFDSCEAVDVGTKVTAIGFHSENTYDIIIDMKNCTAKKIGSTGTMVRGFNSSNSTPTIFLQNCLSVGHTEMPYSGNFHKVACKNTGSYIPAGPSETITLSSDTIDITNIKTSNISIEGESGLADDLSTISTTGGQDGDIVWLKRGASAITIKDGVGNITILNHTGSDYIMTQSTDQAFCKRVGGAWIIIPYPTHTPEELSETISLLSDTLYLTSISPKNIIVNGQGSSADDLSTISYSGSNNYNTIWLTRYSSPITIKNGVGNLIVYDGDYIMNSSDSIALCKRVGSNWAVLPFS